MKNLLFGLLLTLQSLHVLSQDQAKTTVQNKVYDKKGKLIQRNRVNYFGNLEHDVYGIASIKYEYDRKGNLIKKSYFDKNNKPYQPDTSGKHGNPDFPSYTTYQYENNKLVQVTNYNTNGTFIDLVDKAAIKRYKYDQSWKLVEETNYDKTGKLVGVGRLDVAITKYAYNFRGQLIEEKSYDINKKILDFGMNIARHSYDSIGRKIRTSYFFANSDLYHTDLFFYDAKNMMVKEESYNKFNKLEYVLKVTYDFNGQVIKKIYEYPDGTSKMSKNGIDLEVKGWKLISEPTISGITDVDGYGSFLIKLDKDGNIIEIKNSSCKAPLAYAMYPYIKQIKISRDASVKEPNFRGELRVGVLNFDPMVEEF
jgi:YD repeat-containing protein